MVILGPGILISPHVAKSHNTNIEIMKAGKNRLCDPVVAKNTKRSSGVATLDQACPHSQEQVE